MPNLQDGRSPYQYAASSFAATPMNASIPPLPIIQTVGSRSAPIRSPSPPGPIHAPRPVGPDASPIGRELLTGGDGSSAARSASPSPGAGSHSISQHAVQQHQHQQQQQQHHPHHHGAQPPQQQLLPPTCGARQLSKLKRFLTTLQQFAVDISPETGDHVRCLVLAVVNSQLSVEEFHAKLQQATNFPLRPFVIPFLKANLPLLQREMLHCAQLARQSPHQYIAAYNERAMLDAASTPASVQVPALLHGTNAPQTMSPHSMLDMSRDSPALSQSSNGAEKRKSPNDSELSKGSPPDLDIKRPRTVSSVRSVSRSTIPAELRCLDDTQANSDVDRTSPLLLIKTRDVISRNIEQRHHDNDLIVPGVTGRPFDVDRVIGDGKDDHLADSLKHVDNLLQSITGMVNQCKMAIGGLREQWKMLSSCPTRSDGSGLNERAVADAVNEVKCKAIVEIQKVMAESETKTERLVAAERARLDFAVAGARQQAMNEILQTMRTQHDSPETCWNCGRKATETCSGCNIACYCGSFCQHRDWVAHQLVCRRSASTSSLSTVAAAATTSGKVRSSTPSTADKTSVAAVDTPISSDTLNGSDVTTGRTARDVSLRSSSNDENDSNNDVLDLVKYEQLN